jgi:Transposase IS66 family
MPAEPASELAPMTRPASSRRRLRPEGGLPTEALVADIVVSKYAWHLPLYRQAKMMAAEGITIDRSTLAHWVGFAAFELMPVYDRLVASLKSSRPAICGRRHAMIGPGAAPIRRQLPTRMHPAAASSMRCAISSASPAPCRSTATWPTSS